jgi:short-subunit dehydrogenase
MKIEGKVALITGASQGIGAACAAEFARAGARLSLTARSEEGLGRAARQAGGQIGERATLLTAGDLTDEAVRRRVMDRTIERFGAVDILINNAGVGVYGPSWEVPMEQARGMMELNYFALLGMLQLAVPHMRARRTGAIVNVGSIGGKVTLPWMTLYSSTKYALGSLTEGLRMELKRDGVHAMLVCPGYVTTGFQQNVLAGAAPPRVVRARRFAIAPEECAQAIRRGVERDARTVMAPFSGWLLVAAMRLLPGIVEARMAHMNES